MHHSLDMGGLAILIESLDNVIQRMKWILTIISLAILQSYVLGDGHVFVLTDDNYESTLKDNQFVMVKFFAPWCGHCKAFAPEYEKAAEEAKNQGKPYILAELDATVHKNAAEKEGIEGFPTIKLFINGVPINYDGERTADAVLAFLNKKTGPASTLLESESDIENLKNSNGKYCIFSGAESLDDYVNVAMSNEKYSFFHADAALVKKVFPEAEEGNVVLLKEYDEKVVIYKEKINPEEFGEFLKIHELPIVTEVNDSLIQAVFSQNGRIGIFLYRDPENEESKAIEEEFGKFASEIRSSKYGVGLVDLKSDWGTRMAEVFAITDKDLPLVEIVTMDSGMPRYKHTGEFNLAGFKKFFDEWKEGKVPIFYKSEEIPAENPGPVYIGVGKNFAELVLDNDDDVFVKFYAPWCHHCQDFAPIFVSLAESLKENKKLKFVEVDVTKNDIQGHPIEGLPTIKFFTGKDKTKVIDYSGDRSKDNVIDFLTEHASYPLEVPKTQKDTEQEDNDDDNDDHDDDNDDNDDDNDDNDDDNDDNDDHDDHEENKDSEEIREDL